MQSRDPFGTQVYCRSCKRTVTGEFRLGVWRMSAWVLAGVFVGLALFAIGYVTPMQVPSVRLGLVDPLTVDVLAGVLAFLSMIVFGASRATRACPHCRSRLSASHSVRRMLMLTGCHHSPGTSR